MDKFADYERQRDIESLGWKVYRFTGAECFQDPEKDRDAVSSYERLESIGAYHGISQGLRCHDGHIKNVMDEYSRGVYRF